MKNQKLIIRNLLLSAIEPHNMVMEKRSNPTLNTYESADKALMMYRHMSDVYIQFSNTMKIGLNPTTHKSYNTPAGIYTYPINYILDLYEESTSSLDLYEKNMSHWEIFTKKVIPFAGERKYIHVFQVPDSLVVDASDYTESQFKKDARALYEIAQQEKWFKKEHTFSNFFDRSNYLRLKQTVMSSLFSACSIVLRASKRSNKPWLWNRLLRELGYYGISDKKGTGTIHDSEPYQAFFLSIEHLTHLQTIDNKKHDEWKGREFDDLPYEGQIGILAKVPELLKNRKTDEKMKLDIVKKNPLMIRYIENPSEAVQLEAIKQDEAVIRFIRNPSEVVQLQAIRQNKYIIKHINNPTETVQLEAVRWDAFTIEHIDKPSEAVQLEAVKQEGYTLEYIKNPSEAVQIEAVKENGYIIKYIKNPTEAIQLEAVKQNPLAIKYIKKPTETVQFEAVKQNPLTIQYIKKPTEAVKKKMMDLQFVSSRS